MEIVYLLKVRREGVSEKGTLKFPINKGRIKYGLYINATKKIKPYRCNQEHEPVCV